MELLLVGDVKKQSCVALSTAEAEYMALASAAQEAVWMQRLQNDLNQHSYMKITNPQYA